MCIHVVLYTRTFKSRTGPILVMNGLSPPFPMLSKRRHGAASLPGAISMRTCQQNHIIKLLSLPPVLNNGPNAYVPGILMYSNVDNITRPKKMTPPRLNSLARLSRIAHLTQQAVEEYRRVLESPSADESERQEVLTRCGNLLRKMGRNSELDQLREACSSRGKMQGGGGVRAC